MTIKEEFRERIARIREEQSRLAESAEAARFGLELAVQLLSQAVDALPDEAPITPQPPAERRLQIFVGRERLWNAENVALRLDQAEAHALKFQLGIAGIRETVDVGWICRTPGFFDAQRLVDDVSVQKNKQLLPILDLRYAPPSAVRLDREYTPQCRVCSHPPSAHGALRCGMCEAIETGKAQPTEFERTEGVVFHSNHNFWLADARTAYQEGINGSMTPRDWHGQFTWWENGFTSGEFYDTRLEYLQPGKVPHLVPEFFFALGEFLARTFGDDLYGIGPVNEPANPRYFPPSIDQVTVWNTEGSTHEQFYAALDAVVRRLHDEMVIPLVLGLRSVHDHHIRVFGPSGDTLDVIRAVLADEPRALREVPMLSQLYTDLTGHPYGWGADPDPLIAAQKRAAAMLAVMREFARGRVLGFDEYDDNNPAQTHVQFAEWCRAQGDLGMLTFHRNLFFDEDALKAGRYELNSLGRNLAEFTGVASWPPPPQR